MEIDASCSSNLLAGNIFVEKIRNVEEAKWVFETMAKDNRCDCLVVMLPFYGNFPTILRLYGNYPAKIRFFLLLGGMRK